MAATRHPRRTDEEWLRLIQECRTSGLSDKNWCEEHHIHTSNFYYHIRRLRNLACDIPEPVSSVKTAGQEFQKAELSARMHPIPFFVACDFTAHQIIREPPSEKTGCFRFFRRRFQKSVSPK